MKTRYLQYKDITDEEYETLSDLINSRLTIYDLAGEVVEYDVLDLQIDENGVIYAPTKAEEYDNSDYSDNVPTGVREERRVEFSGYEPIYTILKNQ